MILVDSCVWLDIVNDDPDWRTWSEDAVAQAAEGGEIAVNPIIYAEVSVDFARHEDVERIINPSVRRLPLPYEAGFLAGKAFGEHRRRGGPRTSLLPDFFIGAHAVIGGMKLLTRDPQRFRSYYPKLQTIAP